MLYDFRNIGLIGAGNMAEAMIGGIIQKGFFPASRVFINDLNEHRMAHLKAKYGVVPLDSNHALFTRCDIVALCIKPQQLENALDGVVENGLSADSTQKLVISILAGKTLSAIETLLYPQLEARQLGPVPIVRVMPNTPALVGGGMAGICGNRHARVSDLVAVRAIFESVGRVIEFEENAFDAITALSGTGPAYVFYLAEAMIRAGEEIGLSPAQAAELTIGTIKGAALLLETQTEDPATLRRRVTSPGGTTEAAIGVFKSREVNQHIVDAIKAAARRSEELH